MATLTSRLLRHRSSWLGLFVERLLLMAVAWLLVTGLIETVRSGDYPSPLLVGAAVVGSALGATFQSSSSGESES